MDLPHAPKDIGLRNIIDKLAEFVARNGPEFESMTKSKQKSNPKFGFLYGGEYYNYYIQKVNSEQEILKQQMQQNSHKIPPLMQQTFSQSDLSQFWSTLNNHPPAVNNHSISSNNSVIAQLESFNVQKNTLREQIIQSEKNLQGHHRVLMQDQQSKIEKSIIEAQDDLIQREAEEIGIKLDEFENVLQPIIDSCTKDSISSGKSWILQHSSDSAKCNVISKYLLKKALISGTGFSQKLHLIYLINDVLHHCVRKNADDLKNSLENVTIPMFCATQMIANEEQQVKLTKLLSLWESKANFFDACVMSKLRSPASSMQEYKTNLLTIHAAVVNPITQASKSKFDHYQQQHQAFIQHASQQISMIESQILQLEQQSLNQQQIANIPPLMPPGVIDQSKIAQTSNGNLIQQQNNQMNNRNDSFEMNHSQGMLSGSSTLQNSFKNQNNFQLENQISLSSDFSLPPPNFLIPDLSKPPPNFTQSSDHEDFLIPTVPYFELPAGLVVSLIKLEDYGYKPLDSSLIKLPPPTPPSERLLGAFEAFYSLPSHERPRDGDGWEKLGLYEYYKVKNAAKKQKEEEIESGVRLPSRSPSPIEITRPKSNKRRYRSKSRSRSRSKSPGIISLAVISVPPPPPPPLQSQMSRAPFILESRRNSNRRMQRRSPSPSQTLQKCRNESPPTMKRDREKSRGRDKDRLRSVSPPSFFGGNYAKPSNEYIEESNKGHQMLMKMGWSGAGTGLGTQGQGIETPISGGDVRDRKDMYKGVGISLNDPFENFRKNKGAAFVHRMKSRAEERT